MNAPSKSILSLVATAIGMAGAVAHAQSLTLLAANCANLADPPNLLLLTGQATSAGSNLIVAVAGDTNSLSDLTVEDAAVSRYSSVGGSTDSASGFVLSLLRAPLERALPASSQITIAFGNASPGTEVCAQVYSVGGIGFSGQVLDALAAGNGSASPELYSTLPAGATPELTFAAFASDASIGAASSPATAIGSLCAANVCLTSAFYFSNTGGTASIDFSGGSQTHWAGALGALYADDIFGNGFN